MAARRQARAEAREIRMKELEKQQKELDETSDRHFELLGNDPLRCGPLTNTNKTPILMREVICAIRTYNKLNPVLNLFKCQLIYRLFMLQNRGSSSYASSRRSSEDSLDTAFTDARDIKVFLK